MSQDVIPVRTAEDLVAAIGKWLEIAAPFDRDKFTAFCFGFAENAANNAREKDKEMEEGNDDSLGK